MSGIQDKEMSKEDAFVWMTNVISCVLIIMVNKQLTAAGGYGFTFVTTLSGMHFMVTGAASRAYKYLTSNESNKPLLPNTEPTEEETKKTRQLPILDLVIFVFIANLSIVSLNTSLMINHVSLYQIAKLGITPLTACIERLWLGSTYTIQQVGAMAITLSGVALVTVAEFNIAGDSVGIAVAAVSVVASSLQQILCGHFQRKNQMSSNDFLDAVSMWQGATCLIFGPFMDYAFTQNWIGHFEWNAPAILFLSLSCLASVVVNASHFKCLGRFTAVTYQILGYTKTILVLVCGYYFFGGDLSQKQLMGGSLAVIGMITYGYFTQQKRQAASSSPTPTPKKKTVEV